MSNNTEARDAAAGAGAELQLCERRELTMDLEALLEALLEFDRVNNGWLWRATDHNVSIGTTEPPTVIVEARREAGGAPELVTFSIGHVGASFIHMCRILKIPMPRSARKQIRLSTEGAALVLLLEATIRRRHVLASSNPVRGARTTAATAAPAETAAPEPVAEAATATADAAAAEPAPEAGQAA